MIDGLQGENGDLNNKYLKKNLKESVANIWKHTGGFRSLQNFHNTIHYLRNVIFRYFTPTLLDFYLKIFGVIINSLLVIS